VANIRGTEWRTTTELLVRQYRAVDAKTASTGLAFSIRISETPVGEAVVKIKAGQFRPGEVIDMGEHWRAEATRRLHTCSQKAHPEIADAFLLRVRKAFLT